MTVTDNATALARAVLAGDAPAVAGLVDEALAELDLGPGRDWLAVWDAAANAYLSGRMAQGDGPPDEDVQNYGTVAATLAHYAYGVADAFMAERARRLAARAKPAGAGRPRPA